MEGAKKEETLIVNGEKEIQAQTEAAEASPVELSIRKTGHW